MNVIQLLMRKNRDRNLLEECLKNRYVIKHSENGEGIDAPFDLCITDGWSLKRMMNLIHDRKNSEKDVFLPFLLVTTKKDVGLLTAGIWKIIDEVITTPIQKAELHARVEVLVRTRRLSIELKNSKETQLHRVKQSLAQTEELQKAIIASTPLAIYSLDKNGNVLSWNPGAEAMFGWSSEEIIGRPLPIIPPDGQADFQSLIRRVLGGEIFSGIETVRQRKDGVLLDCSLSAAPIRDDYGNITGIMTSIENISERKALQTQLIQAQKMESIGRLAGGVAHDYNNFLSVILGYTEMALEETKPTDMLHGYLKEIYNAAERSRDITRQLLTFARREIITPKILDINTAIENMLKMLRRLIGEDIELIWIPGKGNLTVFMDPSQLDQILANLCVNARDAIHNVGKITIKTTKISIDKEYCANHVGYEHGNFVLLSVTDNGCGMDKETQTKIFEPFFTTKGIGKGTGLGLATVFGIVKQNNGFIKVFSELGQGTTFKIYLPTYTADIDGDEEREKKKIPIGSGETLLVVEDEISILDMITKMLTSLNYTVISARTPSEALRIAELYAREISLVITDVVMPEMNGKELLEKIKKHSPTIKCLFTSGHTVDAIARRCVLDKSIPFIHKPFSRFDLATKVKAILNEEQ